MGMFGEAREVFEEAMAQLANVRDFGVIFNAYVKFEEAMLEHDGDNIDGDSSDSSEKEDSDESEQESLSE